MCDHLVFKMPSKTWEVNRILWKAMLGFPFQHPAFCVAEYVFVAVNFYFEPKL